MELIDYFLNMWKLAVQGETQGIWFGAALYAFILGIYSLIFQFRTRYWPFTPGQLAESAVE